MKEEEAIKDIEFIKAAYENLAKNGADRYRAVSEKIDCAVEIKTNAELYSHYAVSLGMAAEALNVISNLRHRNMTMAALEEYMKFEDECVQKGFTLKKLLEVMEKQEPMIQFTKTASVGRSEYLPKPKAIYIGFSSHDCESRYKCPCCDKPFGSWEVFNNKKNENGTKHYCPSCKTELDGLE